MSDMTTSDEDPAAGPPTPPPAPPPPTRRLRRSTNRYLGGVAGGIAEVLDVDPLVVRLGLVVAVLYAPWIIALYVLAWLVLPDARTERSLLRSVFEPEGWRAVGGVLLLGLGALLVTPDFGRGGDGALTGGAILLGLGILMVRRHPAITGLGAGSPPPDHGDPAGPPVSAMPAPTGPPPIPTVRAPFTLAWLARRGRPSSRLAWFGLSALVVLVGLLAAVDRGVEPVKPGVAVSLCLLLLGAVLLVSAWRGRARLLLPVGLALLPLWLGWTLADVPRYPHDGDADYTLTAGEALPVAYEHGYGSMDVDLRQLRIDQGDHRTLQIGLTAGRARLYVPGDLHVVVDGDVGLGHAEIVEDPYDVGAADASAIARHLTVQAGDAVVCTEQSVWEPYPDPHDATSILEPAPPRTEYRTPFGERCRPTPADDDPAVLEVTLDLGIGSLEVHRVHPRP